MMKEIVKPKSPKMPIPAAETFAIVSNSFRVGFFKTFQTLTHFLVKSLTNEIAFAMINLEIKGF